MNVFMTSATGYVGGAVAAHLLAQGHRICALARSDTSVAKVLRAGIVPVRGSLADPEAYLPVAAASDVVIHTALDRSLTPKMQERLDFEVTYALMQQLSRNGCSHFVYTSDAMVWAGVASEGAHPNEASPEHDLARRPDWRCEVERAVLTWNGAGIVTSVIRPGLVYGRRGRGTISELLDSAMRHRVLKWPGRHAPNRWSLVHLEDLASLYVRVIERSAAGVFDAVDGRPRLVSSVVAAICAHAGVPSIATPTGMATSHLPNCVEQAMRCDLMLDASRARALGWRPLHDDLEHALRVAQRHSSSEGSPHSCFRPS